MNEEKENKKPVFRRIFELFIALTFGFLGFIIDKNGELVGR